jgi:hypothetical protein
MSHKKEEKAEKINIVTGPGSDGNSDSPIIITDGSIQVVSINDDFHPNTIRTSSVFSIQKSNNGTAVFKPGNIPAAQVPWTLTLTDNANNVVTIAALAPSGQPANGIQNAFFNWTITVTTNNVNNPITRFDMNGGESRVSHAAFQTLQSAALSVNGGQATELKQGAHVSISIHFR